MSICVTSEIAPLRRVLLHRPGRELEHLSPEMLARLLFDDIPYLQRAQEEHDFFADVLRREGAEVVYLEDLMSDVLRTDESVKRQFVGDFIRMAGIADAQTSKRLTDILLNGCDERELVRRTVAGITDDELPSSRGRLSELVGRDRQMFIVDPLPNLYFTRDTFSSIGRGASVNRMYSAVRQRETIYASYIFRYHPDFRDTPLYYTPQMAPSLEGGDILNFSETLLGVGISQRTSAAAVESLARGIFADERCPIRTVLAFTIPPTRAFMHIDTVFTQVAEDAFTVHPGIIQSLRVFELTPGRAGEPRIRELAGGFERILMDYLHLEKIRLIYCGGGDRIASEREQWNDGSNTLCVRPGVVVVYDRNTVTNRLLEESGIKTIPIPSSELSRGRGGPRCMSMPLARGAL
ncbi:MAG: arginine deiminase [Oscillospiraceae bacterium]|nr:arginine deiminase [Oscillospiraceae bacterium]